MGQALRRQLYAIASTQRGVMSVAQARPFATVGVLRREFESDRWHRIGRGVYVAAGVEFDERTAAVGRLLRAGPGAVVSHWSALALWGVPGASLTPLHVTRIRHSNGARPRHDGIVPHETRRLPPGQVCSFDGFSVVTPARALADVAAGGPSAQLESAFEHLWRRRLVDRSSLAALVEDLGRRGRAGIGIVAALLERSGTLRDPWDRGLTARLERILAQAGRREEVRQVHFGDGSWLARVDLRVGRCVVVEARIRRHHTSLSTAADNAARADRLRRADFETVALWDEDIWGRPEAAVAAIRAAVDRGHPPRRPAGNPQLGRPGRR